MPKMSKSIYKKIGIASLIMMASVFLSRVIGLFREMVIAYVGGAGAAVDAYIFLYIDLDMKLVCLIKKYPETQRHPLK